MTLFCMALHCDALRRPSVCLHVRTYRKADRAPNEALYMMMLDAQAELEAGFM